MFRCLLVLLLLNSSYRSLGVPVPTTPVSLEHILTALASDCENTFLSNQIKSQIKYCSDPLSHGGKQLECLLFYDINTQLCTAVGASKLALPSGRATTNLEEDYSAKINEEQDVNLVCANTKDWVFSNITEFPHYIVSVQKVFKNPVRCGTICGLEDLISDDIKFACKYFKWGTEILKQRVTEVPTQSENSAPETINENKLVDPSSNDMQDVQIKNAATSSSVGVPSVAAQKTEEVKTESGKPEASSENNAAPSNVDTAAENVDPKAVLEEPIVENPPAAIEQADKPQESSLIAKDETENKPIVLGSSPDKTPVENSQKSDVDTEIQKPNNEQEHKEPVIEDPGQLKPKDPSDDDYQDSEDKDLGDIQGDDDSDGPNIDNLNKIPKVAEPKDGEIKHVKSISSSVTGESVQGLYPSFGQDADDDDDDDHFFSFFLTGIIMVVVIYILYHNKNRVVKVFFGLILEGRQSGRRRNSRGHSYRRLDTLEQAMSTNSAAPPSKIIY